MSSQTIPQPSGPASAPTEVYSSTDSAPHGPTIAAIGNTGPPPKEVTQHALAHNNIDRQLYLQNVFCGKFTWSVNDQAGKLLWFIPIHPSSIHPILRVLMMIYNVWGGGFELNFSIAGTGFHAGKLAIARIPPNINPEDLAGDYDYTIFEYEVMDAKTLEMSTVRAGDQRQVNYHYTYGDPKDPKSWDIGGYIAVFVHLGLNTASTGTPQIQVIVTAKPAQDFCFAQLKMPNLGKPPTEQSNIAELEKVLDYTQNSNRTSPIATEWWLNTMKVLPSSIKALVTGHQAGYQLDGSQTSKWANINGGTATPLLGSVGDKDVNVAFLHFDQKLEVPFKVRPEHTLVGKWRLVFFGLVDTSRSWSVAINVEVDNWFDKGDGVYGFKTKPIVQAGVAFSKGDQVYAMPDNAAFPSSTSLPAKVFNNELVAPANESFVLFGFNDKTEVGSTQTFPLQLTIRSLAFKNSIPQGQAALFSVIDTQELVPIMSVKFYPEGYFTARANDAMLIFSLQKIRMKFVAFVPRTSEIPVNAPENRVLMSAAHKRALKHSQTT